MELGGELVSGSRSPAATDESPVGGDVVGTGRVGGQADGSGLGWHSGYGCFPRSAWEGGTGHRPCAGRMRSRMRHNPCKGSTAVRSSADCNKWGSAHRIGDGEGSNPQRIGGSCGRCRRCCDIALLIGRPFFVEADGSPVIRLAAVHQRQKRGSPSRRGRHRQTIERSGRAAPKYPVPMTANRDGGIELH